LAVKIPPGAGVGVVYIISAGNLTPMNSFGITFFLIGEVMPVHPHAGGSKTGHESDESKGKHDAGKFE
jgi:hypothetical protein